jgi:hypothetical protein
MHARSENAFARLWALPVPLCCPIHCQASMLRIDPLDFGLLTTSLFRFSRVGSLYFYIEMIA